MILPLVAFLLSVEPGPCRVTPLETADRVDRDAPPSGVPVLCYHHVSDQPQLFGISSWRFQSDLEELYEAGFYLVTLEDLENGLIQVPRGKRPLMLHFDDGWPEHLRFLEAADGGYALDPDCVLGLLESFCSEHPDFGRGATFFVSWDKVPFGQSGMVEEKLNLLLDMGYQIGNHTYRHSSFAKLAPELWEDAISLALGRFHRNLGLRACQVRTVAYPGGSLPRGTEAEARLSGLSYGGRSSVELGFLVNGEVPSLDRLLGSRNACLRVGRIDMSRYTVSKVLSWNTLMDYGWGRSSLHDPLPYRAVPLRGSR